MIENFSPNEPATVIGHSFGGIVALKLLIRRPEIIRTLITYEPPAVRLLPDFEELWVRWQDVYDTYRLWGPVLAFPKLADFMHVDQVINEQAVNASKSQYFSSNSQYWWEREFLYYPKTDFDVEHVLRPLKNKLLMVNGELSAAEALQFRANATLAEKLDLELALLPGQHVGYATHAEQFSQKLLEVLRAKDQYYSNI